MLKHVECPHCGSSDAASMIPNADVDGMMKCFSCDKSWVHEDYKEGEAIEVFKDETWEQLPTVPITSKIRGISPDIFKQYGYYKTPDDVHCINHYDVDGNLVAQKFRYKDKTFSWKGNAKAAVPFGMNKWRSGGKRIVITEGELDCLSIAEALGGKYPIISVNNGAQSAKRDLKEHLEFINSYDEILLAFDNDEAGKKAIQECSGLFTPGKVRTVDLGEYKDFNELLQKQGKQGVIKYYYETKLYTPSGIVNANDGGFDAFFEDITADSVYDTPFTKLDVSKGAITTIVSGSGMGKSTLTREIGYDLLMRHNLTVGHVALEENNSVSKRAYVGINLNEQLIKKKHWHEFKVGEGNEQKLRQAYAEVIGTDRLYLYNHFGSLDSDSLLSKLRYLAVGAGCDFIILDHISIVVSGLDDMGDNERRVIDVLMTKLRSLVEETGVGMILVSHLKRPPGEKGHEDGVQTRLAHLRGSGSIAQLSDSVIGIEGNQQDEANANKRVIRCLKDREGGETGIMGGAVYVKEQGRLLPDEIKGEIFDDETPEY
ncbi:DNA primase [Roseobacter phage CRP-143]|nr:DNA primase [Roseobacter phage CRP-143]